MKNTNRGFTVVESLVAIFILVLAITSAASAVQIGISSYILSKDQIIAFYLAQEAVEQIRNMRDENGLKHQDWLIGISSSSGDPCYFGNACTVDPVASNVATRCSSPSSCPMLRQDTATGLFGYNSSWPITVFRREIILTQVSAKEVSIVVTVNWSKGLISRQFKVRENIINWQ